METNGQPAGAGGGADGLTGFLVPHAISGGAGADLSLLRRAIREDWPMTAEVRAMAIARMEAIIRRESATIPGPGGEPVESEAIADRNAIAATGNLIAMRGQDQRERHHVNKMCEYTRRTDAMANQLGPSVTVATQINIGRPPPETILDTPEDIDAAERLLAKLRARSNGHHPGQ